MTYKVLLFIITATGFVGCLSFVVTYWIKSGGDWWHTETGRFLFVVYVNLGSLFLLIMTNQVFGDWPGRKLVTLGLYITYAVESWWPLRLLIRAQRHKEGESFD